MNGTIVMRVGIPTTVSGLAHRRPPTTPVRPQRPSAHNARSSGAQDSLPGKRSDRHSISSDRLHAPPRFPAGLLTPTESGRNVIGGYPGSAARCQCSTGDYPALTGRYRSFSEDYLVLTNGYLHLTEDYPGFTGCYPGLTVAYPAFTKPYPDMTVPCFSMLEAKTSHHTKNPLVRNQIAHCP